MMELTFLAHQEFPGPGSRTGRPYPEMKVLLPWKLPPAVSIFRILPVNNPFDGGQDVNNFNTVTVESV